MTSGASDPLVGFRAWRATDDGRLHPLIDCSPAAWSDGPWAAAECGLGVDRAVDARGMTAAHDAPAWSCSCGLHAYYEPWWDAPAEPGLAYGAILGSGLIVEHERGFRAERAQIIALAAGPGARRIADAYGVPVLSGAELVRYAGWWGEIKAAGTEQAA